MAAVPLTKTWGVAIFELFFVLFKIYDLKFKKILKKNVFL